MWHLPPIRVSRLKILFIYSIILLDIIGNINVKFHCNFLDNSNDNFMAILMDCSLQIFMPPVREYSTES